MKYWLMKSEPDVFGLDHLERLGTSSWDGVRNYQARNNLQAMQVKDRFLFYHSSSDPTGVVGEGDIVRTAYPDHTAWDPACPYYDAESPQDKPRWFMVDVRFRKRFPRLVTLQELRGVPHLSSMVLLNNSRLSVQPVTADEFHLIEALAAREPPTPPSPTIRQGKPGRRPTQR